MALIDKLTAIGDAIREKNGTTEPVPLKDMPQAILDISSGGAEAAIDYIESISGQYIDTGIAIQKGYRVEIDFQLKSANGYMCGVVDNGAWANAFQAGIDNDAFYQRGHFTYSQYSTLLGRTLAVGEGAMNYTNTLHLFARNWKNNECYASMKLFSCIIYDADNNIIQALVPAVDKNNVVCLYDNVTKSYFYNQGQGAFKGGVMGDDAKEEQEKTIDITENGTTEVLPDEGKVLSRVIVNADVQSGGEEAVGFIYSDFTGENGLPKVVDVRGLKDLNIDYSLFFMPYINRTVEEIYMLDGITRVKDQMFEYCFKVKKIHGDFSKVTAIEQYGFYDCRALLEVPYMPALDSIGNGAFRRNYSLKEFKFYKKPTGTISSNIFQECSNLKNVYCPWAEGVVANAPWGATDATIHYNYVEGEETNADS